jgi:archaellum component FlaC
MNKQELIARLNSLEEAADGLEGAAKTFRRNDIIQLKIKIEGMAIDDIEQKMSQIELPDLDKMDKEIADASDAIKAHNEKVAAFDKAYTFIKTTLGVVI